MKTFLIPALATVLAAGGAVAQTAAPQAAQALFQKADVDGDGRLTRAEFDAARQGRFAQADADHDGRLAMTELRALRPEGASQPQRRPSMDQIQKLRAIDRNGDRAIDAAEFRAIGDERFASVDRNRDGSIGRDEIAELARGLGLGT